MKNFYFGPIHPLLDLSLVVWFYFVMLIFIYNHINVIAWILFDISMEYYLILFEFYMLIAVFLMGLQNNNNK